MITKISFQDEHKWSFNYRGIPINALITCTEFLRKIDNGERFAKGDCLKVQLKIQQILDETTNSYFNKSYEVVKVLKHFPRESQISMDL